MGFAWGLAEAPPRSGTCGAVVSCDNTRSMPVLLRHWRERRGYSVRELARRAGVGFVSVSRIENGRMSPTVAMLEKLARALGIAVRDFFPVEGRPKRRTKR
jgi:transcriptional regulator with XRE-family HTH domain